MNSTSRRQSSPWLWIPTLYFAEGIPYFVVNNISVVMFKEMGVSNGVLALFTSLLYLPWVIKPLWSPFVDVLKTKRWWVLLMQALMTVCFAALALTLPHRLSPDGGISIFSVTLVLFYVTALLSATHDIAADGYYMLALDSHRQAQFVGIRSTFYRIASVFGQGVLVMMAGVLEKRSGDVPKAWALTLLLCAVIFLVTTLWHLAWMPRPDSDHPRDRAAKSIWSELGASFLTFFRKPGILFAIVFMLLFRLPEAFSLKLLTPMMLDPLEKGGLAMSTAQVGLVYGTIGVIALTVGGILGGLAAGSWGLRRAMVPMALSLALPCSVYLFMSIVQPQNIWVIGTCVALDQFGYGFGFTAYMLYMMYFAEGEFKTSHYALCTAFMALSMMLPGTVAGYIQESTGYVGFFWLVMACCVATVAVAIAARKRINPEYGKK